VAALLLLRYAARPFASLAPLGGAPVEAAGRSLLQEEDRVANETARLDAALHAAAGPKVEGSDAAAARTRLAILAVKRAVHNRRPFREDDLAAASRGLDPDIAASLVEFVRALEKHAAAVAAWECAFAASLDEGRRGIVEATRDPLVAFGIALAGRSLIQKIRALDASSPAAWGHGDRHVAAKALAYIARFATKTSPNSVFCATAIARAEGDRVTLDGRAPALRWDLILNVAESRKVACVLAADPAVEAAVVPRPNPTLRDDAGALLFWRFASVRNAGDDESLSRVKEHPVLRAVLEESAARVPLPELRRRVAARCDLPESDLGPFLRRLIDSGVLIGEIEIPYNERRPLRFVATRARKAGCEAPWVAPALAVEDDVDGLATLAQPERDRGMARIEAALEELPHARPIKIDELYRLDAAGGLNVTLPVSVLDELREGLRPYTRLFATLYPARRYLQGWIDRFLGSFAADHDVELMDVYRVLTEQSDTYRPAAFPEPAAGGTIGADRGARAMAAVRDHLAARARASAPGEAIVFDDATLDRLVPGIADPRWACGILFQIAAREPQSIVRGEHWLVLNGIFHGAGLSLSRFAHLLGGEREDDGNPIVRELRRAWSVLNRPNAIVAELTYNHMGRTANAGLRPAIFEHEIELPGDCASPGARVHGLRDLVVRFDTGSGRFVLRLARDGTEVIPVINSGVSPVGFVSFVVAIGEQALQPIGYFPGFDVPGVTHWPRVVAGRVVLFREHWVFRRGEWPEPPARADDLLAFARAALSWRERWHLPRHAFVHSSKDPKPRYIDLASPVFLDLLRRDLVTLSGEAEATLHVTEMYPGPDDLFIKDAEGGHAAEFLVQMDGGPVGSVR
jgi:hypothetical protein